VKSSLNLTAVRSSNVITQAPEFFILNDIRRFYIFKESGVAFKIIPPIHNKLRLQVSGGSGGQIEFESGFYAAIELAEVGVCIYRKRSDFKIRIGKTQKTGINRLRGIVSSETMF
jgi:hypothetical protein